jgi:hypothetical protein
MNAEREREKGRQVSLISLINLANNLSTPIRLLQSGALSMIYHAPAEHTLGTPQSGAIPPIAEQLATLRQADAMRYMYPEFIGKEVLEQIRRV